MRMTGVPGFTNHANMDEIAEQTGGKAYYNTNDFTRVIEDVIRTGSSYYSIAYGTTNTKWNGEFRSIKISVDRPDVQLQHKNGYYAYNFDAREQAGIAAHGEAHGRRGGTAGKRRDRKQPSARRHARRRCGGEQPRTGRHGPPLDYRGL